MRPEKASIVSDLSEKLKRSPFVLVTDYQHMKDVDPVAKVLKTFATEFKVAALKIGLVDRTVLSTAELEQLADLPPRDVLLAQLLGLFLAPATRLVRVLNEPGSALVRLLRAKAEKEGAPAETAA